MIESTPNQDDLVIPVASRLQVGTTTVGVMTAVRLDTGPVARLAIRGADGAAAKVLLSPGEEFSLFAEGRARLVEVRIPAEASKAPGGSTENAPSVVIRRLPT